MTSVSPSAPDDAGRAYVVEMGRSFHAALNDDLATCFIEACDERSRHRLIFATHDLALMRQGTLCGDEMWICQMDAEKGSAMIGLGRQDKARHDSDLLANHVSGVCGGHP